MSILKLEQAVEKLAGVVEMAKGNMLEDYLGEIFPEKVPTPRPSAKELANYVRNNLEVEEIIDLWNVVFPKDRNVWFDDEENQIHYNEEIIDYADME